MDHREVPDWPGWTVPAVLVGGWVAGSILAVLVLVPFAAASGGDLSPAGAVAASIGLSTGLLGAVALLARRTAQPLHAHDFGLHGTSLGSAAAWGALCVAVVGAFAYFWAQVADLSQAFGVPEELGDTTPLSRGLGAGADSGRVDLSPGVATSALGRVVIAAVVAEVVLRGFALAALLRWGGAWLALPVSALLSAGPLAYAASGGEGAVALVPVGFVAGLALCRLYLETDSLYPGAAVSALVLGVAFGQALEWSLAESGALAVVCSFAALAICVLAGSVLDRRRERF